MFVIAILGTIAAAIATFVIVLANSMRSAPREFMGGDAIFAAWVGVILLWLFWSFG